MRIRDRKQLDLREAHFYRSKSFKSDIQLMYYHSQLSIKVLRLYSSDKVFVDDKELSWNGVRFNEKYVTKYGYKLLLSLCQ